MIKITHNAGFFSCCSVRLFEIVDFINSNKKLPNNIDSSEQFEWYKNDINKNKDITFDYFENYDNITDINIIVPINYHDGIQFMNYSNLDYKYLTPLIKKYFYPCIEIENINNIEQKYNFIYENICLLFYIENYDNITDDNIIVPINYHNGHQFMNYSNLDYKCLTPLIKKYFYPSIEINENINNIEKKYNLIYENICVLFYRGNDKNRETKKCGYEEYLNYANQLLENNSKIVFLIQSDETEFIEFMTNRFPNISFYFKDEIRHMKKCDDTVDIKLRSQNYEFSKKYLAITIIMSKCKYIICGSGNCDLWLMLYRGNNKNVIQNLNGVWYNSAFYTLEDLKPHLSM